MKDLKQKLKSKLGEKKIASWKKALHVARIVKNVICWTLIGVLTLAIIVFMMTKLNGDTPTLFGYSLHRIITGSMEPELKIGDVIVNKEVKDASEVKVDDIITFEGGARFDDRTVTHRVVLEPYENNEGNLVVITKGDANDTDDGEILFSSVESKYVGNATFLRDIYNFFFSQWGLIVFIFLLLVIFFDEIMNIVRLIAASREQEEPESLKDVIARLKSEQEQNAALEESTEEKPEEEPSEPADEQPEEGEPSEPAEDEPEEGEPSEPAEDEPEEEEPLEPVKEEPQEQQLSQKAETAKDVPPKKKEQKSKKKPSDASSDKKEKQDKKKKPAQKAKSSKSSKNKKNQNQKKKPDAKKKQQSGVSTYYPQKKKKKKSKKRKKR